MRAPRFLSALAALALGVTVAHAQTIRPPIGGGAIDAAKKNVAATNEQTKAVEQTGGAKQQQKAAAPAPQQKAPPQAGTKAPQKADAKAPQKADAKSGQKTGAKAPGSKADTSAGAVSQAGARRNQVAVYREQYSYSDGGRRDPFVSLMSSGELRPIITDLTLTGVLHDADPRKSLALLVDGSTGESYRVRMGQPLGRMRVTRIGLEDITFTFDEFGLSRQETLTIDRTKKAAAGPRRP
jgi:hypothetical protein